MIDKKLKEAKDYIRLNAKNLTDIHPLLVEVMADTFDLIVDIPDIKSAQFRLHKVCNSHNAPIRKKTNWCGIDKNYPSNFAGWSISNARGTFRTKDGKKVTDEWINQQHSTAYEKLRSRSFWTTNILSWFNGINTGTFNGGSDFMGGFDFFIEDYPHIHKNVSTLFNKRDVIATFDILDWDSYIRKEKLKKLNIIRGI